MPISLLFGASETDVVSSCRNVRRVQIFRAVPREVYVERSLMYASMRSRQKSIERSDAVYLAAGNRNKEM